MKIGFYSDLVLHNDMSIDANMEKKLFETTFNCANLECVIYSGEKKSSKKGICLYSKADDVGFLKKYNFHLVNLANNHIMDFGKQGLKQTLDCLEMKGIHNFGAGENSEVAYSPYVMEYEGESYAFWGFAWRYTGAVLAGRNKPGVAGVIKEKIKAAIGPYKSCDHRIAYFHFGTEFEDYPEPYLKDMIEELFAEDYLDLVLGNHPHCIQGVCKKKIGDREKTCFYSMGNFILPEEEYFKGRIKYPPKSHIGYGVLYDSKKDTCEVVPYKINENGTEVSLISEEEMGELLEKYSEPLKLGSQEYRCFYKQNRNNKKRYISINNDIVNNLMINGIILKFNVIYNLKDICKKGLRIFGYEINRGRKVKRAN